jgi:hypothetical protein
MQRETSSRISVLLLDTLRQFEEEPAGSRDDAAIAGLERYVLRLVGEMDAIKGGDARPSSPRPPLSSSSSKILEILRNTLAQIDEISTAHPDVGDLKSNLTRAIAELQENPLAVPPLGGENAIVAPAQLQSAERCREPRSVEIGASPPLAQLASEEEDRDTVGEATGKTPAMRRQHGGVATSQRNSKTCSAERA